MTRLAVGDHVRRHGYHGGMTIADRTGWTGRITRLMTGPLVEVAIDPPSRHLIAHLDGTPHRADEPVVFCEYAGALTQVDAPVDLADHCTCCRDERRRLRAARPVQLDLWGAA